MFRKAALLLFTLCSIAAGLAVLAEAPQAAEDACVSVAAAGAQSCIRPGSGQSFKDCANCPEMVVVPGGQFTMGSPSSEPERLKEEGPQHWVTIPRPFAVGMFAVTFAKWDVCARDGG